MKMALINCPECDKEISSSATACPHCGFPILQKDNVDKKKVFPKKIWIIVIAILVFGGIFLFIGNLSSNKGYWDNNKWGTSYADIKGKYGDEISDSSVEDGALAMYADDMLDISGLDCIVNYSFNSSGGLSSVMLICSNNSSKTDSEIEDVLKDIFSEEYGEPEKDDYGYDWDTKETIIKLRKYPTMQGGMVITFEPKEEIKTNSTFNVSESGVENVIENMSSYLGTAYDSTKHDWDNPLTGTLDIKGAGGRVYTGQVKCSHDYGDSSKITQVYWVIEDKDYFSELYDIFVEVYGEPDDKFTRESVEWYIDDISILLQYNTAGELTQIRVMNE